MAGQVRDWWPADRERLAELQSQIADEARALLPWQPTASIAPRVAAVFAVPRHGLVGVGAGGDAAWVASGVFEGARVLVSATSELAFGAPYAPGLLALRAGRVLETAVRALPARFDVLLVNATGRDHPRRSGLALHLGAALDVPTVGVTDRTLLASGSEPPEETSSASGLLLDGELVGYWLRSRAAARPIAVHAGWRTTPETALTLVASLIRNSRTPEPLREVRRLARLRRSRGFTSPRRSAGGGLGGGR